MEEIPLEERRNGGSVEEDFGTIESTVVEVYGVHVQTTKEHLKDWFAQHGIMTDINNIVVHQNPRKKFVKNVLPTQMREILTLHGSFMDHSDGSRTRLYFTAVDDDVLPRVPPLILLDHQQQLEVPQPMTSSSSTSFAAATSTPSITAAPLSISSSSLPTSSTSSMVSPVDQLERSKST